MPQSPVHYSVTKITLWTTHRSIWSIICFNVLVKKGTFSSHNQTGIQIWCQNVTYWYEKWCHNKQMSYVNGCWKWCYYKHKCFTSVYNCCFVFGKSQLQFLDHRLIILMEPFCGFPETIQPTGGTVPQIRPWFLSPTASSIFYSSIPTVTPNEQHHSNKSPKEVIRNIIVIICTYFDCRFFKLRELTTAWAKTLGHNFWRPLCCILKQHYGILFPFPCIANYSALANDIQCHSKH